MNLDLQKALADVFCLAANIVRDMPSASREGRTAEAMRRCRGSMNPDLVKKAIERVERAGSGDLAMADWIVEYATQNPAVFGSGKHVFGEVERTRCPETGIELERGEPIESAIASLPVLDLTNAKCTPVESGTHLQGPGWSGVYRPGQPLHIFADDIAPFVPSEPSTVILDDPAGAAEFVPGVMPYYTGTPIDVLERRARLGGKKGRRAKRILREIQRPPVSLSRSGFPRPARRRRSFLLGTVPPEEYVTWTVETPLTDAECAGMFEEPIEVPK